MREEQPQNEIFEGKELSCLDKDGDTQFDPNHSTTVRCAVIPLSLVNKMGKTIDDFTDIVKEFKSRYDAWHAIYDAGLQASFVYIKEELPDDRCVICEGVGIAHNVRMEERSVSQMIDETGRMRHICTAVAVLSCKCMDCTFEWRQLCIPNSPMWFGQTPVTGE